mmetsp:Transcript_39564/g.93165  ORF Transcript_39564/g.93165 Transcript_39564/m.93165 type:complete len:122 (-) Transcript_39564:1217-1582(-)
MEGQPLSHVRLAPRSSGSCLSSSAGHASFKPDDLSLSYTWLPAAPPQTAPTVMPPMALNPPPMPEPTTAPIGMERPSVKTAGTAPKTVPTAPPQRQPAAKAPLPKAAPPAVADAATTMVRV